MKIYVCDRGWAGMGFVVAESLEQAQQLFNTGYDTEFDGIDEYEIENGLMVLNSGDM